MQSGRVETWEAGGFLGMTVKQLEETYGHHHQDFQKEAANALSGQYAARNPVNKMRVSTADGAKIRGISK